jgi:hypothetical protein
MAIQFSSSLLPLPSLDPPPLLKLPPPREMLSDIR